MAPIKFTNWEERNEKLIGLAFLDGRPEADSPQTPSTDRTQYRHDHIVRHRLVFRCAENLYLGAGSLKLNFQSVQRATDVRFH